MKTLALGLAILATAVCELPPPYSGSFRPSQPLILPARGRIQTVYGPPKQRYPPPPQYGVPDTKNVEFLEDLLGPIIPPRTVTFGRPQTDFRPRIVNSQPQTTYGIPTKLPQMQYGAPNSQTRPFGNGVNQNWQQIKGPQVVYGAPSSPGSIGRRPEVGYVGNNQQYTRPSGNNIWQNRPQVQYGAPDISQNNNYQTPKQQPQVQYVAPGISQNNNYQTPREQPQVQYGAPDISQNNNYQTPREQPQVQYGAPDISQNNNYQTPREQPQVQYVAPGISQNNNYQTPREQPQVQYGAPDISQNNNYQTPREKPQVQYGAPDISQNNNYQTQQEVRGLQNQYGVPDERGIESFERFQQQRNQIQQQPPTEQYLPVREAINFRDPSVGDNRQSTVGLSEQYLPIKEATSFRNPQTTSVDQERYLGGVQGDIDLPNRNRNVATEVPNIDFPPSNPADVDIQQVEIKSVGQEGVSPQSYQPVSDRYLPLTTTPRTTATERTTTARAATTTSRSAEGTVRTTEAPVEEATVSESENEASGNPNVAVATAVAGGGQTFYLVQPDGRFQRVVYEKTQEAGDGEGEYTANYNFQNIQADPNLVYTPLITLG